MLSTSLSIASHRCPRSFPLSQGETQMARFIATAHGRAASQASRLGGPLSGTWATARGWHVGGRIDMDADGDSDEVSLQITGGSTNQTCLLPLGVWRRKDDGSLLPLDDTARKILAALQAKD